MTRHLTLFTCITLLAAGCAEEPQPRSVREFLDNPIILEAAMVRCGQDRAGSRYDEECINARQAVARIQVKEEAERAAALEAASERKRQALRRTQQAAAEARRRAAAAEKARREAEYLAQFGVPMPVDGMPADGSETVVPLTTDGADTAVVPDVPGSNAPLVMTEPDAAGPETDADDSPRETPPASDLAAIREELKKRSESDGD